MLYEMAIADAYAIAFEFVPDTPDRPNDLKTFYQHPKYIELVPGQYTDDTQRSIGNANVLLSGEWWNMMAYANEYVSQFKLDPREGYSRGFQKLLNSVDTGEEFINTCRRERTSNGAVMGSAVLGYLHEPEQVKLAATTQACLTHLPATAVHAQIVALSAHYFIYGLGKKAGLFAWLMAQLPDGSMTADQWDDWTAEIESITSRTTIEASSISAFVIGALDRHHTLTGIIKEAVDRGGDTDSAAAAAVAVASECNEIQNDLPAELMAGIEAGKWGVDFLKVIDKELAEFKGERNG